MKRILLFFFFLLSCACLYSQTFKLANTLLWRISGNNLSKPSYLYGTMHLTDKRVFQLGDSLYKAIEQTEGFAAELDMNRLGMQMANYLIADKEAKAAKEAVKVKDAVSPETWKRYKDLLQSKFYKSADKITVDELEELNADLESDLFKKGDMPTFLDAYLFGLARKQGKWVGGLEELQDQIEHIEAENIEGKIQVALFDDKYYRSGVEKMIRIYTAQALDSLDALMYREENGRKDYIMVKRNLKMAKMIDSLSSVRSTVFAVGAAHLPGDSGVISLLQKKGFTVTPVISSKKISADKYISKSQDLPWIPVSIKDNVYGIEMPGIADNLQMFESMGLEMKMFFDISYMKMYMTFGIEMSADRKKIGADSLYSAMRNRLFVKAKDVKEKLVTINGIEGKEYTGITDDGEIKLQIFMPAMEELIVNAVFSLSKKTPDDEETGKFFRSFTYKGLIKTTTETPKTWSTLSYPNQLFSIEMPSSPKETKDVNSAEGKIIHTYQTMDIKNQVFYGMSVTSVKEGMYQPNADSIYFIYYIKETLKSRMEDSRVFDSAFVNFNGYPGYRIGMTGKSQGEVIETKVLSIVRGNRNYYLYAVYSPGNENSLAADRYLASFKILPPKIAGWKTIVSPDTSFSLLSYMPLKKTDPGEDDIHGDADRFILYDSILASTIYIDRSVIPGWSWFSPDTAFLRQRADQYKGYRDSIIDYNVTTRGNKTIADFTVTTKGVRLIQKIKLVLNGNELFELFGHFDSLDLKDVYSRIFDEFRVEKEANPVDRSKSKINELENVLQNAGVEEARRVSLWWKYLSFSKADLPSLQQMSLKLYPGFDSIYNSGLNKLIIDKIAELDSLHTTIDYIRKSYGSIAPADEYVKPFVIIYLANIKTTESYSALKDILVNYPLNIKSPIYSAYRLYDSLELTAILFPEILKYADSEVLSMHIQKITTTLLDSGLINKKMIVDNGTRFVNYAKNKLDNDKDLIELNGYEYYDCIKILGIINSPASNSLLGRFAKLNNRDIRYQTLIAQLTNNQPVDSRTIYTMATTDEYRQDLYDELKKLGKLKLFPVSFLSQKDLGKSKVFALAYNEEAPPLITDAGERIIEYKGKQQKFYLYKVTGEDGLDLYLGIAGPYSLNSKDLVSSHAATGVYWKKKFDAKQVDVFFKAYLLSLEEEKKIAEPPTGGVIK